MFVANWICEYPHISQNQSIIAVLNTNMGSAIYCNYKWFQFVMFILL